MQAFNLTRLNFHSPYKVWIDNGSYKFLTDYGVQYRIEFVENNNIWEDEIKPFQQSVARVTADSTVVNRLPRGLRKGIKQLVAVEYFRN